MTFYSIKDLWSFKMCYSYLNQNCLFPRGALCSILGTLTVTYVLLFHGFHMVSVGRMKTNDCM